MLVVLSHIGCSVTLVVLSHIGCSQSHWLFSVMLVVLSHDGCSVTLVVLSHIGCFQSHRGADWRRGIVVDSGPRGTGFNPQPGLLSLWP